MEYILIIIVSIIIYGCWRSLRGKKKDKAQDYVNMFIQNKINTAIARAKEKKDE